MSTKFAAPGPMAGYLYQIRYGLILAVERATSDSAGTVALETLDDVSFATDGAPAELFQLKHTIKRPAALTDLSTDVWEALRVWMDSAAADDHLHLVTTSMAPDNTAAAYLRPGPDRNVLKADTALELAARTSKNNTTRQTMDAYLALQRPDRLRLLDQVVVLDAQVALSAVSDLLAGSLRWATKPSRLSSLTERLEGWWLEQCAAQISGGSPILLQAVAARIYDLAEQLQDDNLPIDDVTALMAEFGSVDENAFLTKPFVTQLKFVDFGERTVLNAIREWMRASAQRSRWTREQLITPPELTRYERRLIDAWQFHYARMVDNLGPAAAEEALQAEGQRLFDLACAVNIRPRDRCDEPFILRGSLHILADDARVGWHRDFSNLLGTVAVGTAS